MVIEFDPTVDLSIHAFVTVLRGVFAVVEVMPGEAEEFFGSGGELAGGDGQGLNAEVIENGNETISGEVDGFALEFTGDDVAE